MFPPILENVDQCMPDFPRRAEHSRMVSVAPNSARAPEESVHRLGDADRESLNAATNGDVIGFDQHVHMIALDAVVENSEPRVGCDTERAQYRREDILA